MMLIIEARRGGFAGAGGAGDQDQSAGLAQQDVDGVDGQADLLQRQKQGGNLAQDNAEIPLGLEDADAEAGDFAEGETEIGAAFLAHLLDVVLGSDAAHQFLACLPAAAAARPRGGECHEPG